MDVKAIFLWIITGYLLGSIPSAVICGKLAGINDIRNHGSGNMGTLNTFRVAGLGTGLLTLFFDLGKGFSACYLAYRAGGFLYFSYLAAGAAIIGHMFPLYVNFKGGKSLAVYAGCMLYIEITVLLVSLVSWLVFYFLKKSITISSMLAFGLVPPLLVFLKGETGALLFFICFSSLFLFVRHLVALKNDQ